MENIEMSKKRSFTLNNESHQFSWLVSSFPNHRKKEGVESPHLVSMLGVYEQITEK